MEHAKAEWSKWRLTDEARLHRGAHGPGCKIEDTHTKKERKKHEVPEHKQECAKAVRLSRPGE